MELELILSWHYNVWRFCLIQGVKWNLNVLTRVERRPERTQSQKGGCGCNVARLTTKYRRPLVTEGRKHPEACKGQSQVSHWPPEGSQPVNILVLAQCLRPDIKWFTLLWETSPSWEGASELCPHRMEGTAELSGASRSCQLLATGRERVGFLLMEHLISQLHSGPHKQEYLDYTNCP